MPPFLPGSLLLHPDVIEFRNKSLKSLNVCKNQTGLPEIDGFEFLRVFDRLNRRMLIRRQSFEKWVTVIVVDGKNYSFYTPGAWYTVGFDYEKNLHKHK
jgi:hypothetical protein